MKTALRLLSMPLLALLLAMAPVMAQEAAPAEVPLFSQAELEQMLAPVALYPDQLLTQLLMAATYPLELVQAARWSRANPELKGQDAVRAVDAEPWDPSVKAMVAFPEILDRMDADLDWSSRLGDAFLAQQTQVMDTVQQLRQVAANEGNLESNEQIAIEREGPVIVVRQVQPEVIYVPYYDPWVVYGAYSWGGYAPVRWAPWYGYDRRYGYSGFYWGPGIRIGIGFFFGHYDWGHRHVRIAHRPFYYHRPVPVHHVWGHDYRHRRGVPYRHQQVYRRYANEYADKPRHERNDRPPRVRDQSRPDREHRGATQGRQQHASAGTESARSVREREDLARPASQRGQRTGERTEVAPENTSRQQRQTASSPARTTEPQARSNGEQRDARQPAQRERSESRPQSRAQRSETATAGTADSRESAVAKTPATGNARSQRDNDERASRQMAQRDRTQSRSPERSEPVTRRAAEPVATRAAPSRSVASRTPSPRVEQAQRVERAPRVERTQRVERAPRVEQAQRAERAPRVEQAQRVERAPRAEQAQRAERAPRVEREQRAERAPQADRAGRSEQSFAARSQGNERGNNRR